MRARAERLIELLEQQGIDVLLVTGLVNVHYLTGYTGSNGLALVGPRTRTFVTDFRYVEQAAEEVHASFERVQAPLELFEALADALPAGPLRVGFEDAQLTVRAHGRVGELLPDRVELVAAGSLVEQLRQVKEPEELDAIRAACQLADDALEELLADGLIGRTERELALALERAMIDRGARRPSFETIVAAGPHGALPHAQPGELEVREGDLVVIDWGAELGSYCSDCTRTIAAGEPGAQGRAIYELVRSAQLAGLDAVRSGVPTREADTAARRVIEDAGYGDQFGHGLGHGVGLDIHEAPRLSQRSEEVLARGNVVSVEPGVYLPGRFGIRIEDLVVVRDDGPEILTEIAKELRVAG